MFGLHRHKLRQRAASLLALWCLALVQVFANGCQAAPGFTPAAPCAMTALQAAADDTGAPAVVERTPCLKFCSDEASVRTAPESGAQPQVAWALPSAPLALLPTAVRAMPRTAAHPRAAPLPLTLVYSRLSL
jgi:hypothetical protein